jgi:glycosyltransferase 2 family protein
MTKKSHILSRFRLLFRLVGIIILIIIIMNIDIRSIIGLLFNVDLKYLLIAIVLIIPTMYLRALRWRYSLQCMHIHVTKTDAFQMHLASTFIGMITPGRIGEFVKIYYIKTKKSEFGKKVIGVLVDRGFDLGILFMIAYISLFFFPKHLLNLVIMFSIVAGVMVILTTIIALKKLPSMLRFMMTKFMPEKIKQRIGKQVVNLSGFVKIFTAKNYMVMFLYSVVSYFFYYLIFYFLARSIFLEIPLFYLIACLAVTSIVTYIPISILGIGTRDISLIFLFGLISISYENAVAYSFLILLIHLSGALFGFVAWVVNPVKIDP